MFSRDLRARVLYLKYDQRYNNRVIARLLDISVRIVQRILKKFLNTGLLECEVVGRRHGSSFHPHEQLVLLEYVLLNPSRSLRELQYEIQRATGSRYCCLTMLRNLRKFGMSRKLVSHPHYLHGFRALHRSSSKRAHAYTCTSHNFRHSDTCML